MLNIFRGLLAVTLATVACLAQSATATLSGTVADPQDAMVVGARITISDPGRGWKRSTVSSDNGTFAFTQLNPSKYELTVESDNFRSARFEIVLNANDQRVLPVTLQVGGRDSITVTSEAPLIRVNPAVATTVERAFIENQPLNGRSFQTLINLSPGVVIAPASLVDAGQFSVNGQRTGTNYFTVDGVGANFGLPFATTPYEGAGGGTPSFSAQGSTSALASVDAVQEFTIQTSTYAPEFGRQPGAQVAIVTRSGTNALHGTLFEYFRNDKLDANSWFGNANRLRRPALRQNDIGFTVGGPVLIPKAYDGRNRTFFFVSYEGLRLVQPVISQPSRVPSLAARQRATGLLRQILDAYPLPVAAPLADRPDETPYIASFSNPSNLDATSVRIDHAFSERLNVFGRYNYAPSETRERGRFATPSFVAQLPNKTETLTLGATAILTPTLNNDLRFNWSRSRASQVYVQDTFGGARILPFDQLIAGNADPATSLYYLTIGGNDENTISPGTFSDNTQRQLNIVNTTSWVVGGHSLKFGFDYRRLAPSIGGRLYSVVVTIPDITTLATGIAPSGDVREVDSFLEPRYHNYSAFAQDTWRISSRLTFTYGLRWEVNPAPGEANGNQPLTLRGLQQPSSASLAPQGSTLYDTRFGNFAPRLGVAWQPFRGTGTVIRSGFGMFYDLGYAFTGTPFSPGNYPYTRNTLYRNVAIDDPRLRGQAGAISLNPPYPRLFAYDEDYQLPYSLQYSAAIEQPLGPANSVSVSYVGSAGRNLARVESLRTQTLQNPLFTRVDYVTNGAYSDYHSLQAQYTRRMTRGLQALVSYTWAKSLDTASDESITNLQAPLQRYAASADRGPSSFDVRHQFTGSASYEIPVWSQQRVVRALFAGFALDSIVRFRTATPVTVVTGRDPLGLGLTNVARPDLRLGQPLYLEGDQYPGGRIINRAAFDADAPLAQGRQGTLGRGSLRGFGLQQVDLSLRRRFRLWETGNLDFRADAFNLFNRANFANPIAILTSANFGRSTQLLSTGLGGINPLFQIGGPRSLQLALRLQF